MPAPPVASYGGVDDGDEMEEAKTSALKDLPDLGEDDDKFEIEWDKSKYRVCIVEWTKQGHVQYKLKGNDKTGEFDITR